MATGQDYWKQQFRRKQQAVDEVVVGAMLEVYEELTGRKPSDRFREKIEEAVAYDQ